MSETPDQKLAAQKRAAAAKEAAEAADSWREQEAARNEPPKEARSKSQTTRKKG